MATAETVEKVMKLLATPEGQTRVVPHIISAIIRRIHYDLTTRYQLVDGGYPRTDAELTQMDADGDGRVPHQVAKARAENAHMVPGKTIIQDILERKVALLTRELRPFTDHTDEVVAAVTQGLPVYRERVDAGDRLVEERRPEWPAEADWVVVYHPHPDAFFLRNNP